MSGCGKDGVGCSGQIPVEGGDVPLEAGVVLQTPGGAGHGVPAGVLLGVDGPGPRVGRVKGVHMDVDVHALVSHVNEHVLAGVDATDLRGTLHTRGSHGHWLQFALPNALVRVVHVGFGDRASEVKGSEVKPDSADVGQGADLVGAGGGGAWPGGEGVLHEVGVVLGGRGPARQGEGAAHPEARRAGARGGAALGCALLAGVTSPIEAVRASADVIGKLDHVKHVQS